MIRLPLSELLRAERADSYRKTDINEKRGNAPLSYSVFKNLLAEDLVGSVFRSLFRLFAYLFGSFLDFLSRFLSSFFLRDAQSCAAGVRMRRISSLTASRSS